MAYKTRVDQKDLFVEGFKVILVSPIQSSRNETCKQHQFPLCGILRVEANFSLPCDFSIDGFCGGENEIDEPPIKVKHIWNN
jgi:hypothetical protein